jgi:hypothetical protein
MMSTVGTRVEMGARYHGGACLGSLVGRQAPPVCLKRARRSQSVKRARLLRCMSLLLAHSDGAGFLNFWWLLGYCGHGRTRGDNRPGRA